MSPEERASLAYTQIFLGSHEVGAAERIIADAIRAAESEAIAARDDLRIAKLDLKVGDVLVVKCSGTISDEVAHRVHDGLQKKCPSGTGVMVIDENVDLSILSFEQIAQLQGAAN